MVIAMIETVSIGEAKNKLTQLVRRVEAGAQVIIMKDRRPVARIVSEVEYERKERALAVAGLRARRARWLAAGIHGEELAAEARELLEERP
jgi:prevent-host-death family protein